MRSSLLWDCDNSHSEPLHVFFWVSRRRWSSKFQCKTFFSGGRTKEIVPIRKRSKCQGQWIHSYCSNGFIPIRQERHFWTSPLFVYNSAKSPPRQVFTSSTSKIVAPKDSHLYSVSCKASCDCTCRNKLVLFCLYFHLTIMVFLQLNHIIPDTLTKVLNLGWNRASVFLMFSRSKTLKLSDHIY